MLFNPSVLSAPQRCLSIDIVIRLIEVGIDTVCRLVGVLGRRLMATPLSVDMRFYVKAAVRLLFYWLKLFFALGTSIIKLRITRRSLITIDSFWILFQRLVLQINLVLPIIVYLSFLWKLHHLRIATWTNTSVILLQHNPVFCLGSSYGCPWNLVSSPRYKIDQLFHKTYSFWSPLWLDLIHNLNYDYLLCLILSIKMAYVLFIV